MRGWHRPPVENEYITIELSSCLLIGGGDFVTKKLSLLCVRTIDYTPPRWYVRRYPPFHTHTKEVIIRREGTKESDREEGWFGLVHTTRKILSHSCRQCRWLPRWGSSLITIIPPRLLPMIRYCHTTACCPSYFSLDTYHVVFFRSKVCCELPFYPNPVHSPRSGHVCRWIP